MRKLIKTGKKMIAPVISFLLIIAIFLFAAALEYRNGYQRHYNEVADHLLISRLNLENLVVARMNAISNIIPKIMENPDFSQKDFEEFTEEIYLESHQTVQSISFLKDTTLTHIYPYEKNKEIIGVDLGKVSAQMPVILYAKEQGKAIITAPVQLVEGGIGIIVRVPVFLERSYFGQISVVFDYEQVLKKSGIYDLSTNHYLRLVSVDEYSVGERVIYTNYEQEFLQKAKLQEASIQLYDSKISLFMIPKAGYSGTSILLYMILGIGCVIAIVSSVIINCMLKTTMDLKQSEEQLIYNNDELEAMINQLKANEEQLIYLAERDSLTDLYNRRRFTEDIANEIINEKEGCILLLDIDNFKNINDTQGHYYGDKVLQHISKVLISNVNGKGKVYRAGGDEFAIHFPEVVDRNRMIDFSEAILKDLNAQNDIQNIKNYITASIGMVMYPKDSIVVYDLLMKADIAMYQAKKEGKNRYCFYSENFLSDFDFYVGIEKELQNALEQNRFYLVYQPIINSVTGEVESLEALLRIKDSTLSPAQFIPVAENSGIILDIGHWVIEKVFSDLDIIRKKTKNCKPIAINISPKQLHDGKVAEHMKRLLDQYAISSDCIEIEITENVLLQNSAQTMKLLEKFRDLKIKIALDDFGTGYSSLSYLIFIPVDKVKIDKSLKDRFLLIQNGDIIKSIFSICHGLQMKVVVEGVETIEEYENLRKYSADFLQGYYFAKPMPLEKILENY